MCLSQSLLGQCTNGTQPECACETAPVLCTVDELDGYVFSMSSYTHPQDGPIPICSDAPFSQTNNPTWFAFTAWCSNLTLRATPSNCQEVQNLVGVQIAIYEDCNFNTEVACDVDIQDCNTSTKVLVMTGLTIGGVYYFMVDGCLGSYCTVTIDVVGVCGEEVIAPWSLPVNGETNPCIGDSETYTIENLDGAGIYHWFLDGVLMSQSASTSFNMQWTTPGNYQLCIEASNDPCVPITDDPAPLCINIKVHEANAGVLNVSPSLLCLNEFATITSSGYTQGSDNAQILLVADAFGTILLVIQEEAGLFTTGTIGTFNIYAYNYLTGSGTVPLPGSNINEIDCSQTCCDWASQTITFQGIDGEVSNILCDNNGTDNDPTDDTFTFDVLVTGPTPGASWRSSDGTLNGVFGTTLTCGPYAIAGGGLNFDLHDYDVPTCSTSITVAPPDACSVCIQSIDAGLGSTITCILTTATLTGTSSDAGNYMWSGPNSFISNSLSTTVNDSGWYFLSADFANQCTFRDSVYVDMDTETPIADAGDDQILKCTQLEVVLDGSASTGTNLQFEWTNSDGIVISSQANVFVSIADSYTLQVTNTVNGCVAEDHVEVINNPNIPEWIMADIMPENCIGENNGVIAITDISGGVPPYSYTLNNQMTNASGTFTDLTPGFYTLQILDGDGCTLDTFFTIYEGVDLQLELIPFLELIVGQSGLIQGAVNVPIENLSSIQWSPPGILACDTCLTTMINAQDSYTFQLTVVHQNGCIAIGDVNIDVVPETEIYIPNIFSPNGDGFNDYFTLYSNERVAMIKEINIFDRWGEHIFQNQNFNPNDEAQGWDGRFREKELLPSVFTYNFELLMTNGSVEVISGNVTLMR